MTANIPRKSLPSVVDHDMIWTTLGTMSGPIASPWRSQPANLLWNQEQAILIDAGDGAAEQLAKANQPLGRVQAIILSHLHIDHTGGLSAILGMRDQQHFPGALTIYGPPGTNILVSALLASQVPLRTLIDAENRQAHAPGPGVVGVVEITGGDTFTVMGVRVSTVANSHYGFAPGSDEAGAFQSLSFRFDTSDRSIVYTGDTGPSDAVTALASDADLLISELTHVDSELAALRALRPDLSAFADGPLRKHFEQQHLTAGAVADLAANARVRSLVLTHNPMPDALLAQAGATIAEKYHGPVDFARDLSSY